jgi:hypothetical protein
MPQPHLTPGKDPVPIVQEAGWASGPVWTGAENLAPHRDSIPGPSSPYLTCILYYIKFFEVSQFHSLSAVNEFLIRCLVIYI